MQYIGGKQKSGGAAIAALINETAKRHGVTTYSEPFCGGLSVTYRIKMGVRAASDACVPLIKLYCAMQRGWTPPYELSREDWTRLHDANDPKDPMTAFAGFGCSHSGNWFGAYTDKFKRTNKIVPAALAAAESLTRKMSHCQDVDFDACDFRLSPPAQLTYCDPPYDGTLPYKAIREPWNAEEFWQWAREQSTSRLLAVSERAAPDDFVPALTLSIQNRLQTQAGAERRQEFLFVHRTQARDWLD